MTLGPFFTERGAERYLGIAAYTLRQVARKHPLPAPVIIVDERPAWTAGQLRDWYAARPAHGVDRKSKTFKERNRS